MTANVTMRWVAGALVVEQLVATVSSLARDAMLADLRIDAPRSSAELLVGLSLGLEILVALAIALLSIRLARIVDRTSLWVAATAYGAVLLLCLTRLAAAGGAEIEDMMLLGWIDSVITAIGRIALVVGSVLSLPAPARRAWTSGVVLLAVVPCAQVTGSYFLSNLEERYFYRLLPEAVATAFLWAVAIALPAALLHASLAPSIDAARAPTGAPMRQLFGAYTARVVIGAVGAASVVLARVEPSATGLVASSAASAIAGSALAIAMARQWSWAPARRDESALTWATGATVLVLLLEPVVLWGTLRMFGSGLRYGRDLGAAQLTPWVVALAQLAGTVGMAAQVFSLEHTAEHLRRRDLRERLAWARRIMIGAGVAAPILGLVASTGPRVALPLLGVLGLAIAGATLGVLGMLGGAVLAMGRQLDAEAGSGSS